MSALRINYKSSKNCLQCIFSLERKVKNWRLFFKIAPGTRLKNSEKCLKESTFFFQNVPDLKI